MYVYLIASFNSIQFWWWLIISVILLYDDDAYILPTVLRAMYVSFAIIYVFDDDDDADAYCATVYRCWLEGATFHNKSTYI